MIENLGENKPVNNIIPLVSVCVQTYQHNNYIEECLTSLLNQQTTFPYEIILGDDESTDGTREICISYAEKNPDKIRLFLRSRKDVIYFGGRPTGRFNLIKNLEAARGKYIAFCEGDDYWTDKSKLQQQVMFLEENQNFSLTHTNVNHVDETGNILIKSALSFKSDVFTHEQIVGLVTIQTLTMVFRKSALLPLPPEFYKVFNADAFMASCISEKGKVKFFSNVMGCYRKHSAGVFTNISFINKQEHKLNTYLVMLNYFKSPGVKKNLKKGISKIYARLMYGEIKERNFKKFWKRLIESLKFDFQNGQVSSLRLFLFSLKATSKKKIKI